MQAAKQFSKQHVSMYTKVLQELKRLVALAVNSDFSPGAVAQLGAQQSHLTMLSYVGVWTCISDTFRSPSTRHGSKLLREYDGSFSVLLTGNAAWLYDTCMASLVHAGGAGARV
jgi:hypothetical protein